jgi:hypothetical protein
MLKWGEETAKRHNLEFKYTEGFQRIVLESEAERPPEAAAVEAQTEP